MFLLNNLEVACCMLKVLFKIWNPTNGPFRMERNLEYKNIYRITCNGRQLLDSKQKLGQYKWISVQTLDSPYFFLITRFNDMINRRHHI